MKTIYYNEFELLPIKNLITASLEEKLIYVGINNNDLEYYANKLNLAIKKDISSNKQIINQLKEYFGGERKTFSVETEFLTGTEFQKQVWKELLNIPYGKVLSYKELAEKVSSPKAYRAVGNANSKNPIPIIFPCHRVINSNGDLGGYSCGLEVKKFLLELEKTNH